MRTDFSCELAPAATHDDQHLFTDTLKQVEGYLHRQVREKSIGKLHVGFSILGDSEPRIKCGGGGICTPCFLRGSLNIRELTFLHFAQPQVLENQLSGLEGGSR
jgi:hypothetical protein